MNYSRGSQLGVNLVQGVDEVCKIVNENCLFQVVLG